MTPTPDQPTFFVDGQRIPFRPGEPVATALLAAGIRHLRSSPKGGAPRGAFCFMGTCQECLVLVDGARRQSCLVTARSGMRVSLSADAQ